MKARQFNREVAGSGILTDSEIVSVIKNSGGNSTTKMLEDKIGSSINYNVIARELFSGEEFQIDFSSLIACKSPSHFTYFYLATRSKAIQLLSVNVIKLVPDSEVNVGSNRKKIKVVSKCTFELERFSVDNYIESLEEAKVFAYDMPIDSELVINFPQIKLLPRSLYRLILSFGHKHNLLCSLLPNASLHHEYLSVNPLNGTRLFSQVQSLKYKVL